MEVYPHGDNLNIPQYNGQRPVGSGGIGGLSGAIDRMVVVPFCSSILPRTCGFLSFRDVSQLKWFWLWLHGGREFESERRRTGRISSAAAAWWRFLPGTPNNSASRLVISDFPVSQMVAELISVIISGLNSRHKFDFC